MDEKDHLLLHLLEENSRLSSEELGLMAELSAEEAGHRVTSLEENRIIRKYTTIIDWEKAADGGVAAVIELKVNPERDYGYDRIAERLANFPEVRALRLITGVYDLQLVVTGKTMHEVARFVSESIAPMDRIRETATHIVMKTFKENGQCFYEREAGERIPYSL
ncbi:MAG TPA: Lrp/AsnC family transcriptional regulator [Desulfomonilia bacterium]|nr:Lrp/AsnC family transcriptional regulator [Desulfomonilia bacterium]